MTARFRPATLTYAALATTLIALTGLWLFLFRYQFIHGDDYRHLYYGRAGAGGHLDLGQLAASYWMDYTRFNGRMADTVSRLICSQGQGAVRIIIPVLLVGFACVIAWLIGTRRRAWWGPAATLGVSASLLVIWLLTVRRANGDVIYWVSGFTNYVIPLSLTIVAARLILPSFDRRLNAREFAVAAAVTLVAGVQHEQSAIMVCAITGLVLLVRRFRAHWTSWALCAVAGATFLWVLLSPGLARRSAQEAATIRRSDSGAWQTFWWTRGVSVPAYAYLALPMALILIVFGYLAWRHHTNRRRLYVVAGSGLGALALGGVGLYIFRKLANGYFLPPKRYMTAGLIASTSLVTLCLLVALTAAWLLVWWARERAGMVAVVAVTVASTVLLANVSVGIWEGRPWFSTGMWLLICAAVGGLTALAEAPSRALRPATIGATLVCIGLLGAYGWQANAALTKNWRVVGPFLAQLRGANATRPATIVVPQTSIPRLDYTSGVPFYLTYSEKALRRYYAIPATTRLTQK